MPLSTIRRSAWLPAAALVASVLVLGTTGGDAVAASGPATSAQAVDAEGREAAAYLNTLRAATGLHAMDYDPLLSQAAKNHQNYLALNKGSPTLVGYNAKGVPNGHYEVAGLPGYTGDDDEARLRAVGGSGHSAGLGSGGASRYKAAIDGLIQVPLHRRWLLSEYTKVGFGKSTAGVQVQLGSPGPETGRVIVWPYDGMTGVPIAFGGENPSPVPPTVADGGGYSITAQTNLDAVRFDALTLRAADGTVVDTVQGSARGYEDFAPGLRIPVSRLAYATRYTVTASVGGAPRTWAFTTRGQPPTAVTPSVRRAPGGIRISWAAPSAGVVTGYRLKRWTTENPRGTSVDLPATANFFVDGGPYPDPGGRGIFWAVLPLDETGAEPTGSYTGYGVGPVSVSVRPEWHAQWVRQSPDRALAPGEIAEFWVDFVNLGNQSWVKGAWDTEAHLALNGDDQRPAQDWGMNPGTWLAADRLATHDEPNVAPGETGHFRFQLRAPPVPGTYALNLRSVVDGRSWMEDDGVFWTVTVRQPYHSQWVAQTPYPTISVGETVATSVTFRNSGTATWTKGTAVEARLGLNLDDRTISNLGMSVGWPFPERPAVQEESSVNPGGAVTFIFKLRGVKPGIYQLHLRPVIDGVTWMEDEGVYLVVTVR